MFNTMKVLAIIPARGGSKGIPNKNIKLLNDKPLIQYTIEVANNSKYIDDVVVSTDSDTIASISMELGVQVIKRPSELSGDTALVVDAVRYTIDSLEKEQKVYDIFLLLEPTSPLRTKEIIDECIEKFLNDKVESVTTFTEVSVPPHRIWRLKDQSVEPFIDDANPWLPRQKLEIGYQLNGLVYALRTTSFKNMKKSNSLLTEKITPVITTRNISIDIDDMDDFRYVEFLMKQKV